MSVSVYLLLLMFLLSCNSLQYNENWFSFNQIINVTSQVFTELLLQSRGYYYRAETAEDDRQIAEMTYYLTKAIADDPINQQVIANKMFDPLSNGNIIRINVQIHSGNISNCTVKIPDSLKHGVDVYNATYISMHFVWSRHFSLIHPVAAAFFSEIMNQSSFAKMSDFVSPKPNNVLVIKINLTSAASNASDYIYCSWWEMKEFYTFCEHGKLSLPKIYHGLLFITYKLTALAEAGLEGMLSPTGNIGFSRLSCNESHNVYLSIVSNIASYIRVIFSLTLHTGIFFVFLGTKIGLRVVKVAGNSSIHFALFWGGICSFLLSLVIDMYLFGIDKTLLFCFLIELILAKDAGDQISVPLFLSCFPVSFVKIIVLTIIFTALHYHVDFFMKAFVMFLIDPIHVMYYVFLYTLENITFWFGASLFFVFSFSCNHQASINNCTIFIWYIATFFAVISALSTFFVLLSFQMIGKMYTTEEVGNDTLAYLLTFVGSVASFYSGGHIINWIFPRNRTGMDTTGAEVQSHTEPVQIRRSTRNRRLPDWYQPHNHI